MKIGVFGDSYADKSYLNKSVIWYNFLGPDHTVDCFGEWGSSILFSAELIEEHASNYDLVIWCLTIPGRFSLPHIVNNRTYHITTSQDRCKVNDVEISKKHSVCSDYLKYIFNWETENFVGEAIVNHLMIKHKNIMIIPCFYDPLRTEFNLYKVCEDEAQHYFPNQTIPEIYKTYQDKRAGHITVENQKVLAKLINENLQPGIFQTSYSNFVKPTAIKEQIFLKL